MSPQRRSARFWSGAVTAALALSFLGTGQASAADVNNAQNAGFESGLGNWTCSANSGTTVSSPVHSGSAALKATPAGQDAARAPSNHSPAFFLDESALDVGLRAMLQLSLDYLHGEG